jgi:hypothetical protein
VVVVLLLQCQSVAERDHSVVVVVLDHLQLLLGPVVVLVVVAQPVAVHLVLLWLLLLLAPLVAVVAVAKLVTLTMAKVVHQWLLGLT